MAVLFLPLFVAFLFLRFGSVDLISKTDISRVQHKLIE